MATTFTKWILLTILSVAMKPEILIQGQQQVRCMFLFGDSQFDNGNNNGLITLAKTNYRPYGIDYPDGPTGRSTNGQNLADVLARLLGFANPIPPFVTTRGSDVLRGLNYASFGGGILDETGAQLGDRFSLNRQLRNHEATIDRIVGLLGNRTAANVYLRQCLYVVNIGADDYINNYYLLVSPSRVLYTPERFAEILIQKFSQQLRTLYNVGARKVAVFGLPLLGCLPQELTLYPTNGSPCVDFINDAVQLFNNMLISLINDLNSNFPDARFTYINFSRIQSTDPSIIGIRVTNAPCCEVQILTGLCAPNRLPCSNRNEYLYYDRSHPTEIYYTFIASRAYNATSPSDAIPVDIRTLARQ